MNRILTQPPQGTPTTYVFGAPLWLVLVFRCVLLILGCVTAVLSAQSWPVMPLTAQIVAALLIPALLASPIWSGPWQYAARFIANEYGIYFPAYPPLILPASTQRSEVWLAVPWQHIANIRLANAFGEDGNCVAFDIKGSSDEKSRFFEAVGSPKDRPAQMKNTISVAYGGWPPSPAHAVQRLLHLRLRSETQPVLPLVRE